LFGRICVVKEVWLTRSHDGCLFETNLGKLRPGGTLLASQAKLRTATRPQYPSMAEKCDRPRQRSGPEYQGLRPPLSARAIYVTQEKQGGGALAHQRIAPLFSSQEVRV
jgi:hypothetical protein